MRTYVERLMRCGVPKQTAICICNEFRRNRKLAELEAYIRSIEDDLEGGDNACTAVLI